MEYVCSVQRNDKVDISHECCSKDDNDCDCTYQENTVHWTTVRTPKSLRKAMLVLKGMDINASRILITSYSDDNNFIPIDIQLNLREITMEYIPEDEHNQEAPYWDRLQQELKKIVNEIYPKLIVSIDD